jgi:hypothetical protein
MSLNVGVMAMRGGDDGAGVAPDMKVGQAGSTTTREGGSESAGSRKGEHKTASYYVTT